MIVGYMASELSRMLDSEQRGTFTVSNLVYGTLKHFEIASVFSQSGGRKSRHQKTSEALLTERKKNIFLTQADFSNTRTKRLQSAKAQSKRRLCGLRGQAAFRTKPNAVGDRRY